MEPPRLINPTPNGKLVSNCVNIPNDETHNIRDTKMYRQLLTNLASRYFKNTSNEAAQIPNGKIAKPENSKTDARMLLELLENHEGKKKTETA